MEDDDSLEEGKSRREKNIYTYVSFWEMRPWSGVWLNVSERAEDNEKDMVGRQGHEVLMESG